MKLFARSGSYCRHYLGKANYHALPGRKSICVAEARQHGRERVLDPALLRGRNPVFAQALGLVERQIGALYRQDQGIRCHVDASHAGTEGD